MARTVKTLNASEFYNGVTHTSFDYKSQTPGEYSLDNYYLRELQDKVDAEWDYRPNRAKVEYETETDSEKWAPIEVVIQSVKSEKGKPISEDYLNLVFRDIQEDRFDIGHKFRFSRNFKLADPQKDKNIWLVTNRNPTSMTSSVVLQRCNGTLGSLWVDEQGVAHNHYEPAILSGELNSVNLFYNSVADAPQAHLVVIVQQNKYTSRYQMNQRFLLGARYENALGQTVAQAYRIKTIDRFYGLSTNDPDRLGLMRMYMEITETSEYDNFETRIAYQEDSVVQMVDRDGGSVESDSDANIIFVTPEKIPVELGASALKFTPVVNIKGTPSAEYSEWFSTRCSLENLPADKQDLFSRYIDFEEHLVDGSDSEYWFALSRKRIYLNGDLIITCLLPAEHSPSGEDLSVTFRLVVSKQEA